MKPTSSFPTINDTPTLRTELEARSVRFVCVKLEPDDHIPILMVDLEDHHDAVRFWDGFAAGEGNNDILSDWYADFGENPDDPAVWLDICLGYPAYIHLAVRIPYEECRTLLRLIEETGRWCFVVPVTRPLYGAGSVEIGDEEGLRTVLRAQHTKRGRR